MSLWFATVIVPPLLAWAAFLVLATLYTLPHVYRSLGGEKLQRRSPPFRKTVWRGVGWATLNSAAALGLSFLFWPLYHGRIHLGALPSAWIILLQIGAFLLIDDALFYVAHRALHTRWLFRHIHSWHHRVFAPYALLGSVMHPIEYLVISGIVVVPALLLGMHAWVFWICVVLRQWINAEFHAGIDGPFSWLSRVPGAGGVRHHDLHHEKVHGNYASFFSYLDRWLGTELHATPAGATVAEDATQPRENFGTPP